MLYKELSAGLSDKHINNTDGCYVKREDDRERTTFRNPPAVHEHQDMT